MIRLARGGLTQDEVARVEHAGKRTVGECARVARERALTADELGSTGDEAVDALFPKAQGRRPSLDRLQPDMAALVERKKRNRKLPLLIMWTEHVQEASERGMVPYAYSTFCQMFAEEADRMGATRHFNHVPGAKAYIDWCGDVAHLTDRLTGAKTKVYVFVLELPFSNEFWAEGFCDMRQASWQAGHSHAFERFGGVPGLLVPDNAPTATNHSHTGRATVLNEEYERFAHHYGTAVLPARVRKPRDKSTSESTVNLVETWIIAPSEEMTFYTLEDFNEYCAERVGWLNARPFSAKDGSRDEVFLEFERDCLLPLPPERYEMCDWLGPKVAADYHVQVDKMRYSVPHKLIGETLDAKASPTKVTIYHDGEVVATHTRLRGRRNQHGTLEEHMPEAHRALSDPWSRERFERWAGRIGPETGRAIGRLMGRHKIVQQSFLACRNILGLAEAYTPELPGRACASCNEVGAYPTYTGVKNRILSLRGGDAEDSVGTRSGTCAKRTAKDGKGAKRANKGNDNANDNKSNASGEAKATTGATRGASAYKRVGKETRNAG